MIFKSIFLGLIVLPLHAEMISEENSMLSIGLGIVFSVLALLGLLIGLYKKRRKFEMQAQRCELNQETEDVDLSMIQSGVCGQLFDIEHTGQRDIFYRFLQNSYFNELLFALYKASEEHMEKECHQKVKELLEFQKHFKKSEILAQIKDADGNNDLAAIATLLRPYMHQ